MATPAQIRTALAAQLAAQIPGLRAEAALPGQINVPAATVRRHSTTYGTSLGPGSDDHTFAVTLFLDLGQYDDLDAFLAPVGALSIRAAVEADPTLGGVVDSAAVVRAQQDQVVEYSAVQYLSAELLVEVF